MSSPLDSRMRAIAREEAAALLGVPGGVQVDGSAPTVGQLQEQIAELSKRLDVLEKTPGQPDREERPSAKRAPRKAAGTAPTPE